MLFFLTSLASRLELLEGMVHVIGPVHDGAQKIQVLSM